MHRPLLALLAAAVSAFAQAPEKGGEKKIDPAFAPITDIAGLPRVLIIGDSISIGYTVPVRELLAGVANVHRIPANGDSTAVGIAKLDLWLGAGKWDVIVCNWGLHDLKHWKDGKLDVAGPQVTPVADYEKNLGTLFTRLQASGAKVLFATTTPVPDHSAGRVEGDEIAYNAAATRAAAAAKVTVIDLHAVVAPQIAKLQLAHNVHFQPAGNQVLAEAVAAAIKKALP